MSKFTEAELSRILSAHANGDMRRRGMSFDYPECVCVMQAAYGALGEKSGFDIAKDLTTAKQQEAVHWFDRTYDSDWTPEQFLAHLEARGLA
jgi:hypothetical protein